ncbi:hypothetical protein QYE76_029864 [Lolium multiflorum]|uniref:Uncharacterized protein n=1 Tax=Lolium multiflorum TaxID=4521 RepID=A0AAD8QQ30_LOLMU|nr:hypothetical protein QYE76_029864 [Lolium multiflorum]
MRRRLRPTLVPTPSPNHSAPHWRSPWMPPRAPATDRVWQKGPKPCPAAHDLVLLLPLPTAARPVLLLRSRHAVGSRRGEARLWLRPLLHEPAPRVSVSST